MKKFLLSTVAIAMLSTAASAADLDVAPEPIIDNWAGWYAGLNVGHGFANNSNVSIRNEYDDFIGEAPNGPASVSPLEFSPYQRLDHEASGFFGGGQVGYNWQSNEFVYGLEGDFQFSDIDGTDRSRDRGGFIDMLPPSEAQDLAPLNGNGFDGRHTTARQKLKWFSTVRGRFGVAPTEYLMFYATAGLAFGQIKNNVNIEGEMAPFAYGYGYNYSASSSKTKVGWTIGFGNELKVSENVSLKFEYLYLDLGKRTLSAEGELGCVMDKCETNGFSKIDNPTGRYKLKNQFHTLKAGVNFMF
jgi:outer membrane immunogenic protein